MLKMPMQPTTFLKRECNEISIHTTTYNLLKNEVYAQRIKPINIDNVIEINTYLLNQMCNRLQGIDVPPNRRFVVPNLSIKSPLH
jgi:anionic cell wall polymer biosynthesis LytR-Cps2A-Psr (LCP) family protein